MTTTTFNEIPMGGLFVPVCSPYIKISATQGIPVLPLEKGVHKRRFKKSDEVELPKSMKFRGKAGAQCNVEW